MVLRVGVLGLSHDHIWPNLKALAAGNVGRLVAVAELDPALRARLATEENIGVPAAVETHASYEAPLARDDLDAIFVYSNNRESAALARQSVERRFPTMIEKPMAADLAGADGLVTAAEFLGVPLMGKWRTAWG